MGRQKYMQSLFKEQDVLSMMEQYFKNEIHPESANNINSSVEQNEGSQKG